MSSFELTSNQFLNATLPSADSVRYRPTMEDQIVTGFARLTDILMLGAVCIPMAHLPVQDGTPWGHMVLLGAIALVVATTVLNAGGCYGVDALRSVPRQLRGVAVALVAGSLAGAGAALLLGFEVTAAATWGELWLLCAGAIMLTARFGWGVAVARWVTAGRLVRHVAVVGAGEQAQEVAQQIARDPANRVKCVGLYHDGSGYPDGVRDGSALFATEGGLEELVQRSRRERIDSIVVSLPSHDVAGVRRVLDRLSSTIADIQVMPLLPAPSSRRPMRLVRLAGHTLFTVGERPHKAWDGVQKAVFDRVFAGLLLLALSPVLLIVAALIRIDSPGPVLFRQPRVGFNNRLFHIYKFRSMYTNQADLHASRQTSRDDPRVTAVGRWIRKLSIDELPQVLNVLRGDMSLVGPRPHALNTRAEERALDEIVENYANRHRVLPGITGWAQVNGFRGELRTAEEVRGRVEHDLYYIDNWSLSLDLRIMVLTLLREVRSRHAF